MNDAPLLIDARDAAYLLGMLPARVLRLAKRGVLPSIILPDGVIRFRRMDLEEWIARLRQPARPQEAAR